METSTWQRALSWLEVAVTLAAVAGSAGHLITCWEAPAPWVPRPVWAVVAVLAMLWHHYRARVRHQTDSRGLVSLKRHERRQAAVAALIVLAALNMALGAPLAVVSNWITQGAQVRQAESAKKVAQAEVLLAEAYATRRTIEAQPAGQPSPSRGTPARQKTKPEASSAESTMVGADRDAQEDINRWGTLFSWLLAVLAIVLSVVTSWIIGLLKDAREQVIQARSDRLTFNQQQHRFQRAMQIHDAGLVIQRLHTITDPDSPDRQFLRRIDEVLAHAARLRRNGTDKVALEKKLGLACRTLGAMVASLESQVEMRRLLHHDVLPALRAVLDDSYESDLLQDDSGRRAVEALGSLVRVLEDA